MTGAEARLRDGRARALLVASITLVGIVLARVSYSHQPANGMSDFDQVWVAARALRAGADPYRAVAQTGWPFPFYYPATAAVVVMPLSLLTVSWARAVFMGMGTGVCAWALTRDSYWPALGLLSGSYFSAFVLAQWSPLIVGAAFLPPLAAGAILSAKPTIGLALGIAFLVSTRRQFLLSVGGAALVLAASLALDPHWPTAWAGTISEAPHIVPLCFLLPLGPLLLVAILRWRRPEGRLILAMACVPMTPALYTSLALFLVPKTRREVLVLALLSDVAWGLTLLLPLTAKGPEELARQLHAHGTIAIALLYLPSIITVLRRPNEGPAPAWLDAIIGRLRPSSPRGTESA